MVFLILFNKLLRLLVGCEMIWILFFFRILIVFLGRYYLEGDYIFFFIRKVERSILEFFFIVRFY